MFQNKYEMYVLALYISTLFEPVWIKNENEILKIFNLMKNSIWISFRPDRIVNNAEMFLIRKKHGFPLIVTYS